jgi:Ice-binding-like
MPNNIVLLPAGGNNPDQITLTGVTSAYNQPSAFQPIGVTTYSFASVPAYANNALLGKALTITGFANANNNGTFLVVSSTATSVTVTNAYGVVVTAAGLASFQTQLFPAQYASKIEKLANTNQGDNVSVNLAGGETLVAVAIGLKSLWPFDQLHGSAPYPVYQQNDIPPTIVGEVPFGFTQGLNDFNANPVISDNSSVTPESPFDAELGVAANYSLLAAAGITNTGSSVIAGGNVGSYPTMTITPGAWTLTPPAAIDETHAAAAQGAALAAYNFFSAETFTSLSASTADLSVLGNGSSASTYVAGNYSAGSSMDIPTSITLDAQGNPNATWIFKAGSTVTLESGASVLLINGAQPQNVVWLVGSSFTSVATSNMVGTIIANTSITLGGGTLSGRALAGVVTTSGAITISAATNVTTHSIGGSVNNWTLLANIDLVDSDYTVSATPPTAPNPWPSSKWSIDGYYPSLYVWVATGANAGTYNINLNSVYQNGIIPPQDLAAGKQIFDGGVNFQVFKFTGAGSPEVSFAINTSSAAVATPGPITTTATDGDALISIGLMKNGNVFSAGTQNVTAGAASGAAMNVISSGKLVGSEAHYIVEYGLTAAGSAGSFNPNFSNPLGYEMIICSIAIEST